MPIAFLWGFNFVVAKTGVENIPPVFFAGYRFVVAALVLWPWLRWLPGQMRRLFAIGLTSGALHFGLMLLAFSLSDNVGAIAVVTQLNVPFMVILAMLFLGERVGAFRIGGMVLAFSGVMLIGFDPAAFEQPLPLFLVMAGGFSYAVSVILMRDLKGG
ncbi:MAG: DMT family transporter, partial [Alphaproteobacteria bacterium]|nr:DMT family transporter [Alphaproteobacteria bacterium]